ncbi:MAG: ShlB/FhaC/HecB family hemolysin secretion/activation protein [Cyclobacteriaceae bacterium]
MQRSFFLLFFLSSFLLYSQVKTEIFVDGELSEKRMFNDSLDFENYISGLNLKSISKGFLFAGLDSVSKTADEVQVFIHKGNRIGSTLEGLNHKSIGKSIQRRVRLLGSKGYPFASIRIDSTRILDSKLTGSIVEKRGPFIENDSAVFFKEVKTSKSYIYHLLEHVPGEPFNELNYGRIDDKIERSSFLSLTRPVDISFQNGKAKLYLDIEEQQSGSFQGVLGLQQEGAGNTSVVGSFDLSIQNLFRSGKELEIVWESFRKNSQELNLFYKHPFIVNSPITPFFRFSLTKQDSVFLSRSADIGFSVFISPKIETSVAYLNQKGSLLTTSEGVLLNSDIADFNSDAYRIELKQGRFSRLSELKSSLAWSMGMGLGTKSIEKNLNLSDEFYDTLELRTTSFLLDLKLAFSRRVFNRQTIFSHLESKTIDNDELLNNERFRLGGLNSLRGFDEKSFFTDRYFLMRTEFRSFFEKGSFVYIFFDHLWYSNAEINDTPFATGAGFSLATQSGQFSFALAVGKSENQQIAFSNMKIHFGYITRF